MNTITEAGRKTSINSLLNPEASSSALTSALTHLPNPSLGAIAANHQGHAPSQTAGLYEAQHYGLQATTSGGSFNLRAADWSVSDERHEFSTVNGTLRFEPSPGSINPKDQNSECPASPPAASPRPRASSNPYTSWPPPGQAGAFSYGFPMIPQPAQGDQRTGLSGDYQHYATSAYAAAYPSEDSISMGKGLQATERASVRIAARETRPEHAQAAMYPAAIVYAPFVIGMGMGMAPANTAKAAQQQQQAMLGQGVRVISPAGAHLTKRPASEDADAGGSKAKKPKGNNPQAPGKRGYSAKKRSEAAHIAAQNAAAMIPNVSYTALADGKGKQKADARMQIVPTDQNGTVESSIGILSPELQFARCMSNRYKNDHFPRCVSCTRRWAGDTCRFQGIRFFLKNANQDLVGVSFLETQKEDGPNMEFPDAWNVTLEAKHIDRTKRTIAEALLPILQKEQKHAALPDIIRRPRESDVRATCDTCMTSIFSSSWMCRLCGREACAECYATVSDLTAEQPNAPPLEAVALQMKREKHAHANPFFLSCTRRNEHAAKDFSPVSRFCETELAAAIKGMEELMGLRTKEATPEAPKDAAQEKETAIVEDDDRDVESEEEDQLMDDDDVVANAPIVIPKEGIQISAPPVSEPAPADDASMASPPSEQTASSSTLSAPSAPAPPSPTLAASPVISDSTPVPAPLPLPLEGESYLPSCLSETTRSIPSHVIPRYRDEDLTEENFPSLWVGGCPLVVEGVGQKFKIQWTPEYFKEKHGTESCIIIECQTEVNKRITVGEFFNSFGQYEDRDQCWKLKDWPTSTDFKSAYPDLYRDFSQAVPVPSYVRRDGVLNIASHFPSNTIAPDLGPKMYNAMASSLAAGSKGSTRLHMDMADALNIMTYAEPCADGSEGCAAWDLFRAEDSDKIRKFLVDKFGPGKAKPVTNGANTTPNGEAKPTGQEWNGHTDPIHGQQFYLDEDLRKELWETYDVISYRHYQRPGEAIFIPAGCAHQVANLADCIKVAVDYVSPENVERCERLTREFREQNQRKVWKEDVLQLRTMMWFAWLSCCKQEKEMNSRATSKST